MLKNFKVYDYVSIIVGEKPSACLNCAEDFKQEKEEEEVGAGGGRGERGCRFVFIAGVMPFYKVPSPTSTSQPDVKRVRAPLRQSQASSPDPPDESRTPSRFISASGSIQNFEGFSDNEAYVNGRGGGFEGSNPAHRVGLLYISIGHLYPYVYGGMYFGIYMYMRVCLYNDVCGRSGSSLFAIP